MTALHDKLANCHPSLARGRVWCRTCDRSIGLSAADALRHGWPKCCGYTMTIDSPDEQRAIASCGTHPQGGDAKQAPSRSDNIAVGAADAPQTTDNIADLRLAYARIREALT